jgi:hypothetical protein
VAASGGQDADQLGPAHGLPNLHREGETGGLDRLAVAQEVTIAGESECGLEGDPGHGFGTADASLQLVLVAECEAPAQELVGIGDGAGVRGERIGYDPVRV